MRIWPAILLLLAFAGLLFGGEPPGAMTPVPRSGMLPRGNAVRGGTPEGAMTLSLPSGVPHAVLEKTDRIWSGVIVATNPSKPGEPPTELREFAAGLKNIFGYSQFELVGSATEEIDELTENWLVPSTIFPLSVTARRATSKEVRGGYLLNVKLFQEKRLLVDTEAKLAPGSPLFIRGPLYGKGQVIIVLKVQH